MVKKLTKSIKRTVKKYEKDAKEDEKLWGSIEKIHNRDESVLNTLKKFLSKNSKSKAPKKTAGKKARKKPKKRK
jgi:hypothetical protein